MTKKPKRRVYNLFGDSMPIPGRVDNKYNTWALVQEGTRLTASFPKADFLGFEDISADLSELGLSVDASLSERVNTMHAHVCKSLSSPAA